MRRFIAVALAAGLVIGAIAVPATAAKKKRKAKPVATKLFLHGSSTIGENDSFWIVSEGFLPMDSTEPAGGEAKSRFITNYLVGPNTACSGNNLFPVWSGEVSGRITGDMKLTFSAVGTPGPVEVRVWPDIPEGSVLCNSDATGATDYVEPAGAVTVDLPPGAGTVEAVMKDVDFEALGSVIVQLSPVAAVDVPSPGGSILSPFVSRVLYDSTDFASSLEFQCIPTSGKSCTP